MSRQMHLRLIQPSTRLRRDQFIEQYYYGRKKDPTTNPDDMHIGIRNPPDYLAITGRPHGAGTIP
ncbi:hypothetical protein HYR99_20280 [Candidatus Poribacteria bacterium]|nr:hypothetical protein [Candidatus Poribacteria bacterium]